jgi:hypothetical protein
MDTHQHTAFYLDPFAPLLKAMVDAEGGEAAFIRAVQCSKPEVTTIEHALAVACKTIRNRVEAYCGFCEAGGPPLFVFMTHTGADPWTQEPGPKRLRLSDRFIEFLGARWAPRGVANDPTDLNKNWVPNVKSLYVKHLVEGE